MSDQNIAQADPEPAESPQIPEAAAWLGGLGLLPFVGGALLVLMTGSSWASDGLRFYAASILSFMGGVQWGLAIVHQGTIDRAPILFGRLLISVLPALIAWLALLLHTPYGLAVIAAMFAILLYADLQAVKQRWAPAWYGRLRTPLTGVVLVCLTLAIWGTA